MALSDIESLAKRVLEPFPFVKRAVNRAWQVTGYLLSDEKIRSEGELRRVTPEDGFAWLKDPWPWEAGGND